MNVRCIWLVGVLVMLCEQPCLAQRSSGLAPASAPVIRKIDPPNWWAALPSPMLLLHGEGLHDASFQVTGSGVVLRKSEASTNGHWAFLWLDTSAAPAQDVIVKASSPRGTTSATYHLAARSPVKGRFAGFSPNDVMYLIMTDRFADGDPANNASGGDDGGRSRPRGWHGGDFKGIEDHLDYLKQLGVTTVWTTPVTSNAGMHDSYHGYGTTDLYATDPHFGTIEDYQRLATALHARGMKIVLDMVPNHVGVRIPWVEDPPAPEWFHGTLQQHTSPTSPFRFLPDPHAAPLDTANITQGWFTDTLPDLNQENPLVSEYLIDNALWWIETAGIDGLRLDTFPYVGRPFWSEFHHRLHAVYPKLTTVGEVFTPDATITSFFAGGVARAGIDTDLDTPFDFPVYFALRDIFLHDKPMTRLEDTLRQDRLYPHPERLVTFLGNHDTVRFLSEPGNGATVGHLKVAFGLLATLRGTPQLYSGDEIAMRGGADPDNRHDFPGGFPGDRASAFTAAGRTPEQQETYTWLQGLLRMRAKQTALQGGEQQNIFSDDTVIAFVRGTHLQTGCKSAGDERLLVIAGKSATPRQLRLTTRDTALEGCGHYVPVYPGKAPALQSNANGATVTLPANGFAVFQATP